MSSYTTVILTCSHIDEIGEFGMTMLKPMLEAAGMALHENPVAPVYVMDENYLPLTTLIEAIETVPWEWAEQVQLFRKTEHEDRFQEVKLKPREARRNFYMQWVPCEDGEEYDELTDTLGRWETRSDVTLENLEHGSMSRIGCQMRMMSTLKLKDIINKIHNWCIIKLIGRKSVIMNCAFGDKHIIAWEGPLIRGCIFHQPTVAYHIAKHGQDLMSLLNQLTNDENP